jgi:hypothetical protein
MARSRFGGSVPRSARGTRMYAGGSRNFDEGFGRYTRGPKRRPKGFTSAPVGRGMQSNPYRPGGGNMSIRQAWNAAKRAQRRR